MAEVRVPFGDDAKDTAVLLLGAADEADLPPDVVRTVEGAFMVPEEVAKAAGVDYDNGDQPEPEQQQPPPAKKAAKKSSK